MITIDIDGHLVQEKLATALRQIVGSSAWRGTELVDRPRRFRWDMVYEDAGRTVAVEFDGDEHYRHSLKIKADLEKDALARERSWRVVRVPYWVQLTSETLLHYFGLEANIRQSFSHGFITTRIFPASFCEFGVGRFDRELAALPTAVRAAVISSLLDRAEEHGREYVLPTTLTHLLPAS